MKTPGAGHPITILPNPRRLRILLGGQVVADTTRSLALREASLLPVHYIPREDAVMAAFERSSRVTHCPYKGDASYYSLRVEGRRAADAVWSYEAPFPAVSAIAGHLAFYPDQVDAIEES